MLIRGEAAALSLELARLVLQRLTLAGYFPLRLLAQFLELFDHLFSNRRIGQQRLAAEQANSRDRYPVVLRRGRGLGCRRSGLCTDRKSTRLNSSHSCASRM